MESKIAIALLQKSLSRYFDREFDNRLKQSQEQNYFENFLGIQNETNKQLIESEDVDDKNEFVFTKDYSIPLVEGINDLSLSFDYQNEDCNDNCINNCSNDIGNQNVDHDADLINLTKESTTEDEFIAALEECTNIAQQHVAYNGTSQDLITDTSLAENDDVESLQELLNIFDDISQQQLDSHEVTCPVDEEFTENKIAMSNICWTENESKKHIKIAIDETNVEKLQELSCSSQAVNESTEVGQQPATEIPVDFEMNRSTSTCIPECKYVVQQIYTNDEQQELDTIIEDKNIVTCVSQQEHELFIDFENLGLQLHNDQSSTQRLCQSDGIDKSTVIEQKPKYDIISVKIPILFNFDDVSTAYYEIIEDSNDPMLSTLRPTSKNPSDLMNTQMSVALEACITEDIAGDSVLGTTIGSSFHFNDLPSDSKIKRSDVFDKADKASKSSLLTLFNLELTNSNLYETKPCSIRLSDCLSSNRKSKSTYGKEIRKREREIEQKVVRNTHKMKKALPKKRFKSGCVKNDVSIPKKVKKNSKRVTVKNRQKNIVIAPPLSKTENFDANDSKYSLSNPEHVTSTLTEQKSSLVNNWIQESIQIASPEDNDVNELLQDANLFALSDIEDDAFQLAKYLDGIDQYNMPHNESQSVNYIHPTLSHAPQYRNEKTPTLYSLLTESDSVKTREIESDQPLDLSMKQTTPMSTDTGFGNDSSVVDNTLSYASPYQMMPMQSEVIDIKNNFCNNKKVSTNRMYSNAGKNIHHPHLQLFENEGQSEIVWRDLHKVGESLNEHQVSFDTMSQRSSKVPLLPDLLQTHQFQSKRKSGMKKSNLKRKANGRITVKPEAFDKKQAVAQSENHQINQPGTTKKMTANGVNEHEAYSTDLDYEPSEEEAVGDDVEKSLDIEAMSIVVVRKADQITRTRTTQSTGMKPSKTSKKKLNRPIKEIPRNTSKSTSRFVVGSRSQSVPHTLVSESNISFDPFITSPHVNVVQPLQSIIPTRISAPKLTPMSTPISATQNLQQYPILNIETPASSDAMIDNCYEFEQVMLNIFRRPCSNFLSDRECSQQCKDNHSLPSPNELFRKMTPFRNDVIIYIYLNFILKNKKIFIEYFEIMCKVFGTRKMDTWLAKSVYHCEQRSLMKFYKFIFCGYIESGLSGRHSLNMIAAHSCKSSDCYETLLDIMIERDALYFHDMIKLYSNYTTISKVLLKLLQRITINAESSLLKLFIDMLDRYSLPDICDVGTFRYIARNVRSFIYGNSDKNISKRFDAIVSRIN